mgnify:CR=1 FL=1
MMVSALPLDWSLAASRKVYVPSRLWAARRFGLIRGEGAGGASGVGSGAWVAFWRPGDSAVEYHDDGGQDHQDAICQLPRRRRGRHAFFADATALGHRGRPFLRCDYVNKQPLVYKMGSV